MGDRCSSPVEFSLSTVNVRTILDCSDGRLECRVDRSGRLVQDPRAAALACVVFVRCWRVVHWARLK